MKSQQGSSRRASKDRHDLPSLLADASKYNKHIVDLPAGDYRCANPIVLRGCDGLTIRGKDARLIMTDPRKQALTFYNCRNIVLRDFVLDYDPLPFTQGTIMWRNTSGAEFEYELHRGYPAADFSRKFSGPRAEIFDSKTFLWKNSLDFGAHLYHDLYPAQKTILTHRRGRLKFDHPVLAREMDAGDYVVFVNRTDNDQIPYGAVSFHSCAEVRLEDVVIMAAPEYAVECLYMDGENYFRYQVARGPQGSYGVSRLISTNADAFNYGSSHRGPLVENCDFSFMGDDSVNIHGCYLSVLAVDDSRTVRLGSGPAQKGVFPLISPGERIRFFSSGNLAFIAEAIVESIGAAAELRELPKEFLERSRRKHWSTTASVRLDRPVQLAPGAVCDVSSALCNDFTIRNCYFHDHRATGIRLYGGKGRVENNRIERVKDAAITVGNYISEGLWGGQVVIRGNRIRDISGRGRCPGAIALHGYLEDYALGYPQAIRDVVIENNTIENCAGCGIYVNAADGVRISGNTLRRTNQGDFSDDAECKTMRTQCEYAIEIQNSINVDVSQNTVEAAGARCLGGVRPFPVT